MNNKIKVKFICSERKEEWIRYFPNNKYVLDNCQFIFDKEENVFDWLVVYEKIPRKSINGIIMPNTDIIEINNNKTILITTEPSTIKKYKNEFIKQFDIIITTQSDSFLTHENKITRGNVFKWFYGADKYKNTSSYLSRDEILKGPDINKKNKTISVIQTNSVFNNTNHIKRFNYINNIKKNILDLEVFGNGVNNINDKAESLDNFKYHIVIENTIEDNYITEKIIDSFLGRCFPFYIGAPNIEDYFSTNSFTRLDFEDLDKSLKIIRKSIHDNLYDKRIEYIEEARKKILEKENIFSILVNIINSNINIVNNKRQYLYSDNYFN